MFRRIVGFNDELERNASTNEAIAAKASAITRTQHLFALHPVEILSLLESAWQSRVHTQADLGHPDHRSDLPGLPGINSAINASSVLDVFGPLAANNPGLVSAGDDVTGRNRQPAEIRWDHLIYAYLIEATGVLDIFKKVIHEFLHDEKLGVPTPESHLWMRNTAQMFYNSNQLPLMFIGSLNNDIQPDFKATFYNACWRMFAMDSAYSNKESEPYKYIKAETSNSIFVETFEQFLVESWRNFINRNNTSGENLQDNAAVSERADQLHDMLRARREGGNLARVEFWSVSMMSWFHLTLSFNSPIVKACRAEASSPQDRLKKIAMRVGMKSHKYAKHFFDMSEQCSRILTLIESGAFNNEADIANLYQASSPIETDIRRIITDWQTARGVNIKRQTR
ncbi:hypothetical protein MNBD_GAMMA08-825 [hydrothermal vent metagenome]|uniref:Uncharacterized protein n=1 Tax=hydrothermal vent metagenome TaxID=652676 RepID=A0A3B0XA02_9ZZZZ